MEAVVTAIYDSVVEGEQDRAVALVSEALQAQVPPDQILNDGLVRAMEEVGARFACGDFYVPEMLLSARAMQAGLALLRPRLVAAGVPMRGKVVLGTVQGDLHDIGKNLVGMMLEGAGFEIIDLGTDVAAQQFAAAVRDHRPALVCLSALLTTTMANMQAAIRAIEATGLRDQVKILVGGAPLTEDFARAIGADGFAPDASRAAALAGSLLGS
jgi:5-methyltetrahydrofolate--homocysteine methyltransferase